MLLTPLQRCFRKGRDKDLDLAFRTVEIFYGSREEWVNSFMAEVRII